MSDNTSSSIGEKPVQALSGMTFFIPSYQRGYRWGEVQVRQLAEDLLKAAKAEKPYPYCLQPLVVCWDKDKNHWRVIDGQQRLTTLWLLLDVLGKCHEWHLRYERHGNGQTLLKIPKSKPDGFFKDQAIETLNETIKDKDDKKRLSDYLDSDNGPFFLWYEVPKDADEHEEHKVFARLNSGKIPLSNAELIKALLLVKSEDVQLDRKANKWDEIEQWLQNDDFWCFVNPNPTASRFSAARIDFLFELWMRQDSTLANAEDRKKITDNPEQALRENPSLIYNAVSNQGANAVWERVCDLFDTMKEWYDNPRLYHLIGFLMANTAKDEKARFDTLQELLSKWVQNAKNSKHNFEKDVGERCANVLFLDSQDSLCPDQWETAISSKLSLWSYGKDDANIKAALTLFNLALTRHEGLEQTRFPFGAFRKTRWSLEHIHPQDDNGENGVANLALLPRETNSSFQDGSLSQKRQKLREWLGVDESKDEKPKGFIPLGTRLVFARFVGRETNDEISKVAESVETSKEEAKSREDTWDEEKDGTPYLGFVAKTIVNYLKNGK